MNDTSPTGESQNPQAGSAPPRAPDLAPLPIDPNGWGETGVRLGPRDWGVHVLAIPGKAVVGVIVFSQGRSTPTMPLPPGAHVVRLDDREHAALRLVLARILEFTGT